MVGKILMAEMTLRPDFRLNLVVLSVYFCLRGITFPRTNLDYNCKGNSELKEKKSNKEMQLDKNEKKK